MKNTRSGGRSLHAIWFNENLTPTQKLVLLAFSSELNFKGNFLEERYLTHTRWAKMTGYKKRMLIYAINEIEEKGYLIVRRKSSNGKKLPHTMYSLSEKLFDEYAKLDSACVALIDQTDGATGAHVKLDSATGAPCDSACVALIDQTDGATGAPHNSFMNQTPSNSNPPRGEISAPVRVYDPRDSQSPVESPPSIQFDFSEFIKNQAKEMVEKYFSNVPVKKGAPFAKKEDQISTMEQILNDHDNNFYKVGAYLEKEFKLNGYDKFLWDPKSIALIFKS